VHKKSIQEKQKELKKVQQELQTLQSKYKDQSKELSTIQSTYSDLTKENTKMIQSKNETESQLKTLNTQVEKLTKETKSQQDEINSLMVQIKTLETEVKIAKAAAIPKVAVATPKPPAPVSPPPPVRPAVSPPPAVVTPLQSKPVTATSVANSQAQKQLTQDIINMKAKSEKDLHEMECKLKELETNSNIKVGELEEQLSSYEEERKSLRRLTTLGLRRVGSILVFENMRKKIKKNKSKS
jgi:predicted  nucleic acid-binding Zn-ribbon protein